MTKWQLLFLHLLPLRQTQNQAELSYLLPLRTVYKEKNRNQYICKGKSKAFKEYINIYMGHETFSIIFLVQEFYKNRFN